MLVLGIDTGGTYTDGVILNQENNEVIAKAKTLTTKDNLIISITKCIESLNFFEF